MSKLMSAMWITPLVLLSGFLLWIVYRDFMSQEEKHIWDSLVDMSMVTKTEGGLYFPGKAIIAKTEENSVRLFPRMDPDEIKLFESLASNATDYFEFGTGGSTALVSTLPNIKTVHSVDSNFGWLSLVGSNAAVSTDKITFHFVDINASPNDWGNPQDESMKFNWPHYSTQISTARRIIQQQSNINYQPDLILVDGRFRVACALQATTQVRFGGVIAIHDYERTDYHVVEKHLQLVNRVGSLAVFRLRDDYNQEAALEDADANKFTTHR